MSGRAVVIERIGAIPPRQFCKSFPGPDLIRQTVYNRQAALAWTRAISHRSGTNLRRMTVVIDMKGLGRAHLSGDFLRLSKHYISTMLDVFPEASDGFYMINSPMVFRAAWSALSLLLDAETLAKSAILGGPSSYEPLFAKLGIRLDAPSLDGCAPSWIKCVREVCAANDGALPPPFLTPAEADMYACGLAAGSAAAAPAHAAPEGPPTATGADAVAAASAAVAAPASPPPPPPRLPEPAEPAPQLVPVPVPMPVPVPAAEVEAPATPAAASPAATTASADATTATATAVTPPPRVYSSEGSLKTPAGAFTAGKQKHLFSVARVARSRSSAHGERCAYSPPRHAWPASASPVVYSRPGVRGVRASGGSVVHEAKPTADACSAVCCANDERRDPGHAASVAAAVTTGHGVGSELSRSWLGCMVAAAVLVGACGYYQIRDDLVGLFMITT
jgi:hypothetical protein